MKMGLMGLMEVGLPGISRNGQLALHRPHTETPGILIGSIDSTLSCPSMSLYHYHIKSVVTYNAQTSITVVNGRVNIMNEYYNEGMMDMDGAMDSMKREEVTLSACDQQDLVDARYPDLYDDMEELASLESARLKTRSSRITWN